MSSWLKRILNVQELLMDGGIVSGRGISSSLTGRAFASSALFFSLVRGTREVLSRTRMHSFRQ